MEEKTNENKFPYDNRKVDHSSTHGTSVVHSMATSNQRIKGLSQPLVCCHNHPTR